MARHLHLAPGAQRPGRRRRSGRSRAPSPYICGRTSTFRPRCRTPRRSRPSSSRRERHLEVIFGDELVVLLHRVARHADDLDPGLLELVGERGEILRLAGAARRVVLGIEIEHQRPPGAARSIVSPSLVATVSPEPGSPSLDHSLSFTLRHSVPRSSAAPRHAPQAAPPSRPCPQACATSARDCSAGSLAVRRDQPQDDQHPRSASRRSASTASSIRPAAASSAIAYFEPRIEPDMPWSAGACGPRIRDRPARPGRA